MSIHGSPERRPATPQQHLKSFFNAASCTSSSGFQITPPSASRTNLLSITRPFGEGSSGSSDMPESSRLAGMRTSETLTRYPEDTEGSSDDENYPSTQASKRRSRIQAGLKKSSSFGSLFSPSRMSGLTRQRSKPEESARGRDETVGEDDTTRRSESPKKGLSRSGSLKERALELISKSKRSSFSESTRSLDSLSRARSRRSTTPTAEVPSELISASTTPPGTPGPPDTSHIPSDSYPPPSTTPKTTLIHEESKTVVTTSSYRANTSNLLPTPLPDQLSTPRPSTVEVLGSGNLAAVNSLRRGILKPSETPGSGRSVRFGSRNAYRILTPTSPTTSFSSSDQLRTNLFALSRGQGVDRDEDEDVEEKLTPTTGLESSVQGVGKGRPSVARINSASSASSSGSDKGKGRQPSPTASKLNHRPSIEDRLNELYLVGKRTLEASSSESDAPVEKHEPSGSWRDAGLSTMEMPSEGAYQGSEYTNLLMDDGGKLAGFLPEASRMTEGGQTPTGIPRPADLDEQPKDKSLRRTSGSSPDALARAELVNSIHKKREERMREESTVLGLIGDRSSLSRSQQISKDGSFSANQSKFDTQGSPTPAQRRGPISSTPRMSSAIGRVSSSTSRLASTGSGQGSFDVLSHYGDDPGGLVSPSGAAKDDKASLMADSPNLSRWSPDTTGEQSAGSRSVSWAANQSSQGRPENSQMDESDRSVGVMIVHGEASGTDSEVQQEVAEDCSVSMNDSPSNSPVRPGARGKSFWDRIPKLFGGAATVQVEPERTEERSLVLTPTKQDANEKTIFWTPGSAFAANLSQMSAPSSPNQAAVGSEEWTKSLLSLGQALVAAEDEVIYQLKADAKRWRDLAEDLIDKSKQAKPRGKSELVQKTIDADIAAVQEKCSRLSQDLVKAKDGQREAEIQLQGMQRHYSEAKEREERWQARYELLKTSWEEEKQEKEALSVQIRDAEIKQQGHGQPDSATVSALHDEIAELKKDKHDKESMTQTLVHQLKQIEKRYQSEIETTKARARSLEAELEKQQCAAAVQLASAHSESTKLRSQRDLLNVHRQDIETALKVLEGDQASLQKHNRTLLTEQVKLSDRCATLDQEHKRIIKERDEALHLADSRVDRTAYEMALLKRDENSKQVTELSETLETLIVEMAKSVKRNASLEERVATLSGHFDALEEEKETLLRQTADAYSERDQAIGRCDGTIKERDAALSQYQLLQETSAKLEESLKLQQSELNADLENVRSELSQRQQEEIQYQQAVQYLEEQLAQAEEEHGNAKLAIKEMSTRAEQAGRRSADEREKFEQELDAARERFRVLDRAFDQLKEENSSLSSDTKVLQAKLERVASAATDSTADVSSLQSQLETMATDLDRLQKTVHSLRQDNSMKDIQIGKLQRAREQLKEDKEMLNIALDSKQQEVGLLQRKFTGGRTATNNIENDFGESISATSAASRLAMSVRRHAAARRPSAALQTPVPNQRSLERGTPSTIQSSRRFPSVPQSLGEQADVSQVLNSSIKINRQTSLGFVSTSRSTLAADLKTHNLATQHNHFLSKRDEIKKEASPFLT